MQKNKQALLSKLKSTYCRLKPSKVEGVGVFAIRDIPSGINPFFGTKEKNWLKFITADLKNLDQDVMQMVDDFFVIEKDDVVYIPEDGLNGIDISFFVNHSKKPNLKIKGDGIKSEIQFRAARKIKKGEELTVAYNTYDHKYK